MVKTNPKSWFAIKNLDQINRFDGVVLQAEKTDSIFSESKHPVYLCELAARRDYDTRSIEEMAREVLRQNAEIRRLRNKMDKLLKENELMRKAGEKRNEL